MDNATNKPLWTPCAISVIWCEHLVAGGGVWSTFPVLFPKMSMEFFVHGIITAILAFNTLFNFCVAAFSSAGPSPHIEWGKYELVGRKALEGYKFCGHCNLPKPPNAHHCRSCGACVVDMDHHCPFVCEIAFFIPPYCCSVSNPCSFVGGHPSWIMAVIRHRSLSPVWSRKQSKKTLLGWDVKEVQYWRALNLVNARYVLKLYWCMIPPTLSVMLYLGLFKGL